MDLFDVVTAEQRQREKDLSDELKELTRDLGPQQRPAGKMAEGLTVPAAEQMRDPRVQQPKPEKEGTRVATKMAPQPGGFQPPPSPGGPGYVNPYAHNGAAAAVRNATPEKQGGKDDLVDVIERQLRGERASKTPEQIEIQNQQDQLARQKQGNDGRS